MTINERVVYLIKSNKKYTQKDLSDSIGVAPSTVNNWLKLNRSIPAESIIPISEYFGVTVDFVLTGQDSKPTLTAEQQELLDVFSRLSEETQRDFLGAMRLHADLHGTPEGEGGLRQAK